jgi:hypothetical protein
VIDTLHHLPAVCLDENEPLNTSHPLAGQNMIPGRTFLLMGQVSTLDKSEGVQIPIHHYILYDLGAGKMVPGMYHGDRFRFVTDEDNFF